MKVVRPLVINDAVLSASNIAETDYAAYNAATTMRDAYLDSALSAAEALKDILGGSLSTLTPQQILQQQQATWAAAVATNNTDALPDLAKSYLTAAQDFYGSGTGYSAIYDTVTRVLADTAGISGSITMDSVERQIDAITKVQDAISAGTATLVKSIAELKAEIAAMRKDADAAASKIVAATNDSADQVSNTFAAVARA